MSPVCTVRPRISLRKHTRCLRRNMLDKYCCCKVYLTRSHPGAHWGSEGTVPSETPPLPEGHGARFPGPPSTPQLDDRSSPQPHFEPVGSYGTQSPGWDLGLPPFPVPG